MKWFIPSVTARLLMISSAAMLFVIGDVSAAVNKERIQASITRAHRYILGQALASPQGTIAALAYIKSGGDKNAPAIEQVVIYVLSKVQNGTYRPRQHYNYEAGVDLMLLEAIDGAAYRPQMEAMVKFLLGTQHPNGAWFYDHDIEPDCGDTSITQYALLGLWAAARADIEISVDVWEKAARWHISKQREDGGFAYHPFASMNKDPNNSQSQASMTAVGTSNLLIIRNMLFGDADIDPEVRPADSKRRFGVLERFVEETPRKKGSAGVLLRPGAIDKALKESFRWTVSHFIDKSDPTERFITYYLYSVERVAALMDIEKLGTKDWYEDGSDELLRRQGTDGSWTDNATTLASTAFSLMFLSKATTTIVAPKKRVNLLGGGLQAGGRGLPDNLDSVQVKEGTVSSRKIVGPVDTLLMELERSSDAKVEDIQAAVVDAVQLDRPDDLIGQMSQLRKLVIDSRVEVRRTAMWALGRSGDISAALLLIQGLADKDSSVSREASLGLCILSRRPEGCGVTIDPTDDAQMGLKDGATDDERKPVLETWQQESKKRWYDWYQKNRPYDERDDRTALKPTKK